MKEDFISSSMTTCSILSAAVAIYNVLRSNMASDALRVDECFLRVLLDEIAASLDVLTHKGAEHQMSLGGLLDAHLLEYSRLRVHGRFPKLLGLHLGQALEALDVHFLVAVLRAEIVEGFVVVHVRVLPVRLDAIEGRLCDVHAPGVDQPEHVTEEKREQERADVRTVDVGVGQDRD